MSLFAYGIDQKCKVPTVQEGNRKNGSNAGNDRHKFAFKVFCREGEGHKCVLLRTRNLMREIQITQENMISGHCFSF